jgi:nucleotide-binding universal stress UspA family protein
VYVREEHCHSVASYAVSAPPAAEGPAAGDVAIDVEDFARSVKADQPPGVVVRVEEVHGLAARVLLDRCAGADMLVLGTSSDVPGALRSAGPVIRACLRRAPCPVVVIGAAQDPMQRREPAAGAAQAADEERVKVPAGV